MCKRCGKRHYYRPVQYPSHYYSVIFGIPRKDQWKWEESQCGKGFVVWRKHDYQTRKRVY